MYYLLSLLSGVVISFMVAVNGGLAGHYGLYFATVIIHVTGLLVISAVVLFKKEKPFAKGYPLYLYTGGAIGILTVLFNNFAFGRISISSILALGLLGQSVTGLLIDQFGLFQMPKHPFRSSKLIGLVLICIGIIAMTNNFEIVAVILSLATGLTIVVSRTLNAKLGELTSVRQSTFFNYIVGTAAMLIVFLVLGRQEVVLSELTLSTNVWIYFGGALGVCVVLLSNIVVMRVSAFYVTLLSFVGQVFAGILIDAFLYDIFSYRIIIGGILVTVGLCFNLIFDRRSSAKK